MPFKFNSIKFSFPFFISSCFYFFFLFFCILFLVVCFFVVLIFRPFKIQSNDNVQNTLRIIFISRNIKTKVWEIVQIARDRAQRYIYQE